MRYWHNGLWKKDMRAGFVFEFTSEILFECVFGIIFGFIFQFIFGFIFGFMFGVTTAKRRKRNNISFDLLKR